MVAVVAVVCWVGVAAAGDSAEDRVLWPDDPRFERGFALLAPEPGRRVVIGTIPGPAGGAPLWHIAQWNSQVPLKPSDGVRTPTAWGASNAARCVRVEADGTLTLAANAILEYGGRLRERGEPWPHLLVQQLFSREFRLRDLSAIEFSAEVRVNRCVPAVNASLNPKLHAAQLLMFFTVQNRDRASPAFGDYLWFGIPLFDSRHRHPALYRAPDTGTGKFIWRAPANAFTDRSPHDGQWCRYRADLRPLMLRAVAEARERGFLQSGLAAEDHTVRSLNLGWELTGPFDVEAQIRGLTMDAKMAPAPEGAQAFSPHTTNGGRS